MTTHELSPTAPAAEASLPSRPARSPFAAARLVQGVAGAMLMPNVLSVIGVTYTGEDRIKALSWYGLAMGLAAVSGQLIGGLLVQWNPAGLGWRSCFLLNAPH